jgi:hypothetical protein
VAQDQVSSPTSGTTGRLTPVPPRREMPYLVLGVAMVVAGALGAVLLMSWAGQRTDALVLVRDVAVGQPLVAADLRVEPVLAGSSVPVVRAADAASVVGRVAALPLRAGHLLAPHDVGASAWPPPDKVLVAVAAPPGSYPPDLATGMHVLVATGPPDGADAAAGSARWAGSARPGDLTDAARAVVAAVRPGPEGTSGSVVSLLLSRAEAAVVTAVPASRIRLVVVPAPAPDASNGATTPGGGQ